MIKRIIFIGMIGLFLYGGNSWAERNGFISGFVLDENGNTLTDVRISVTGTTWKTMTDHIGEYEFSIPPGSYLIQAATLDMSYEPAIKWVDILADEGLRLNFILFSDSTATTVNCDQTNIKELIALWRKCFDQEQLSEYPVIDNCYDFIDILIRTLVDQWEYQSRDYAQQIDETISPNETPKEYAEKIRNRRYRYNQFKNAHWILSWLVEPPPYSIVSTPDEFCEGNDVGKFVVSYFSEGNPKIKAIVIDVIGSSGDSLLIAPLQESLNQPEWLAVYEHLSTTYRLSPLNFDIWDAMYNYHEAYDIDFSERLRHLTETHPSEFVRRRSMAQLIESYPEVARQIKVQQ